MTAARADRGTVAPDVVALVAAQQWLQLQGAMDVSVPFAAKLAELFPAEMVRARRDFTHLLTLVQAHAILHQRQRHRDAKGRVIAEPADYDAVYRLAGDVFNAAAAGGVTDAVRETVEAVGKLYDGKDKTAVTIPLLAKHLGLHRSVAYRRVVRGCGLGFLVNVETRQGRPLLLVPGEPLPEWRPALPDPMDVCVNPLQNVCNRATEAVGQIGPESEEAVATDVATEEAIATAVATDGTDLASYLEGASGCTVAAKTEGLTHLSPGDVPPCVECGAPSDYTEPDTGLWWCWGHGPIWTTPRRR